ncbi:MAG: hypothetical protein RL410_51 [Actinomycetota bacterium]|jgi:beta-glucanase (GH16 family)
MTVGLVVSLTMADSSAATSARLISSVKLPTSAGAGLVIKATPAKWSLTVTRKYQWYVNNSLVSTTTAAQYKTSTAQKGKTLKVKEVAKFKSGKILTSTSGGVVIGRITFVTDPSLLYTDEAMTTLEIYPALIRPSTARLTYQWYRDSTSISGANSSSYTFSDADSGALITAKVTASATGFTSKSVTTEGIDAPVTNNASTVLLWSDEFDGNANDSPDATKWTAQEGDGTAFGNAGWGNGEMQWYLWNQAKLDGNGNLVITATRTGADSYNCYYAGQCQWISSKLVTLNKVGVKYGRMSVRLKSAAGEGSWPAFWTLGTNIGQVGWPRCGEIDVVELAGWNPTNVWGTPHGPISGGAGSGGTTQLASNADADYHVYTVDWYPDRMVWFVDGVAYHTYRKSSNESDWVFDSEQYLILNLAMGGGFGRTIDAGLQSTSISVDWVRVYSINGVGEIIQH